MNSLVARALLLLGTLTLASLGCQAPDDDSLAGEPSEEEEVADAEQPIEIGTPIPICNDIEIIEVKTVFCGFQTGPYDTSPIQVTCTRTCELDRYLTFTPDGMSCAVASKDCDSWDCPSCD